MARIVLGLFLVFGTAVGQTFREVSKLNIELPAEAITSTARSETGDFYIYSGPAQSVYHYSQQGVLVKVFSVAGVPAASAQRITVMPEVTADVRGNIYIPAVWRDRPKETVGGVFVFDSAGAYVKTIVTNPLVEVRHLALSRKGNLFLLGLDPSYVLRKTEFCLLVHKFSPDGARLTAFSGCPSGEFRSPNSPGLGPDYTKLRREIDLGHVWMQGDLVYHILPVSHLLRVFDDAGKQLKEIQLEMPAIPAIVQPPDPTTSRRDLVARVLPIRGGRYLVEWNHTELTGGSQRGARYYAVNDTSGRLVNGPLQPAPQTAVLFSDSEGYAYMLRRSSQVELVRIDVQ